MGKLSKSLSFDRTDPPLAVVTGKETVFRRTAFHSPGGGREEEGDGTSKDLFPFSAAAAGESGGGGGGGGGGGSHVQNFSSRNRLRRQPHSHLSHTPNTTTTPKNLSLGLHLGLFPPFPPPSATLKKCHDLSPRRSAASHY